MPELTKIAGRDQLNNHYEGILLLDYTYYLINRLSAGAVYYGGQQLGLTEGAVYNGAVKLLYSAGAVYYGDVHT